MPVFFRPALDAGPARWLKRVNPPGEIGPSWRDRSWLPAHDGREWALLVRGRAVTAPTLDDLKSRLHGWSPASTTLMAGPGERRFRPVPDQPELAAWLRRKYTTDQLVVGCICLALAVAAVLGFLSRPRLPLLGYAVTAAIIAIIGLLEAHWAASVAQHLAGRNLFFYWLVKGHRSRRAFRFWVGLCGASGLVQLALLQALGGLEPLITGYGVYYPAVADQEYWRLLTGPFFHSSPAHFMANAAMLVMIGTVCTATLGPVTTIVFLAGSVAGSSAAAFEGLAAGPEYSVDAFSGFSGGVYGVITLLVVAAHVRKDVLPTGIALQLLAILAIGIVGSTLIATNVSTVSHLAGMATGAMAGLLAAFAHRQPPDRAEGAQAGP